MLMCIHNELNLIKIIVHLYIIIMCLNFAMLNKIIVIVMACGV